jgi:hypothetical protein
MAEGQWDVSETPSRGGPACSCGTAATGLGPKQFSFKRVGFVKREVAGPAAICNGLSYERRPEVAGVGVANRARRRCDRHAFDALLVARVQIRIVEDQMLRRGAADAKPRGQRQVDFGRACVRQAIDRQRRFVGDHPVRVWSTHLRPQGGLQTRLIRDKTKPRSLFDSLLAGSQLATRSLRTLDASNGLPRGITRSS